MTDPMSDIGGIPSLILQAAQSAAQADGLLPSPSQSNSAAVSDAAANLQAAVQQQQQNAALAVAAVQARNAMAAVQNARVLQIQQQHLAAAAASNNNSGNAKKKGPALRRGKWTPEEEAYAGRLIHEFKAGLLPLTDGTTLRTFLSKLLNCDPMRISKKFVGSNCIGKQVFRRRTADLSRLTPEQIQQSRAELSELERRFLERVAQTNRVKSSGVGVGNAGGNAGAQAAAAAASLPPPSNKQPALNYTSAELAAAKEQLEAAARLESPNPPWLQPPAGFRPGSGMMGLGSSNSRAAAAGRALLGSSGLRGLGGNNSTSNNNSSNRLGGNRNPFASSSSSGLLAELQRRASQQSLLQNALQQQQQQQSSASNLFAAAGGLSSNNALDSSSNNNSALSMAQFARSASAASLAQNASVNELMLKTGLSRDQLSYLARERGHGVSNSSLSNMIQRQNSFDALMSLDFQSIQSIDNLANLIQSGGAGNVPESGIRNADFGALGGGGGNNQFHPGRGSSDDLAQAARRLASSGRMDALLRNLSGQNMMGREASSAGIGSNVNLSQLLQSMDGNLNALGANNNSSVGGANASSASLLGGPSAVSLANLLRQDSSTGLTALRHQDGLTTQRNSSVDDFLSLVAAGDIPHHDPSWLTLPLMQQQQSGGSDNNVAKMLAHQQQLLQHSNPALANALMSRSSGNLAFGGGSSSSALQHLAAQQLGNNSLSPSRKKPKLEE